MQPYSIWLEIKIAVPPSEADAVANFLIEQGANGAVEENQTPSPDFLPIGNYTILKAYFKKDAAAHNLIASIKDYLTSLYSLTGDTHYELWINEIEDEDWNAQWKSFFQPVKVTGRIVIKPSWRAYWKQADEIIIELDPGMAFGTGTHPSTKLCLQAIEELSDKISNKNHEALLDVGTGSGILAIAAALLGIPKVVGIDIDYQAVECAKKNAEINNVSKGVLFTTSPLSKIPGRFAIVVANILPLTLIEMKDDLISHILPSGYLILSGILQEQADNVIETFRKDMAFLQDTKEGEWSCLIFRRK